MTIDLISEFNRQVENLITKGYHQLLNLSENKFRTKVNSLSARLNLIKQNVVDFEEGKLPFVIVPNCKQISAEKMMELLDKDGKAGVSNLRPLTSDSFSVTEGVEIPSEDIYIMMDIDRGQEYINMTPKDANNSIRSSGRSGLTINEGIALVTQYPDFLLKNNCFSLLASRTGIDKRVPAIWINQKKEPNLGWCWENNPHTWLGSASCGGRFD